jgi:hypothetical protein
MFKKEINAEMPHVRRGVIMLGNVASPYNVKLLLGFYKFRIPAKKFRNLEQVPIPIHKETI